MNNDYHITQNFGIMKSLELKQVFTLKDKYRNNLFMMKITIN